MRNKSISSKRKSKNNRRYSKYINKNKKVFIIFIFSMLFFLMLIFDLIPFIKLGTRMNFSISDLDRINYGCNYPMTYKFKVHSNGKPIFVYKDDGGSWVLIPELDRSLIRDGIEAVRFENDIAFVSVKFPEDQNTLTLKFINTKGDDVIVQFLEMTEYYDNKKMALTLSADNGYFNDCEKFIEAFTTARNHNLWICPALVIGSILSEPNIKSIFQDQLNLGYIEILNHGWNHICEVPLDDVDHEIKDSDAWLESNFIMNEFSRWNNKSYIYAYVEPCGINDLGIMMALGEVHNLIVAGSEAQDYIYGGWNFLFNSYGIVSRPTYLGDIADLDQKIKELNDEFDYVYERGYIYHLWGHPELHTHWLSRINEHLEHISNREDVWYAGFGHIYLYRYMRDNIIWKFI